jgi:hypothetical protein
MATKTDHRKQSKSLHRPVLLKTPGSLGVGGKESSVLRVTWERTVRVSRLQTHQWLDRISTAQIKTRKVWIRAQNTSYRLTSRAKGLLNWVLVPSKR